MKLIKLKYRKKESSYRANCSLLQRAGICILLGGFTGFLPYKEYTMRNRLISNYEGDLSSFQILALKKTNLNCILSKDRVTSSYNRR